MNETLTSLINAYIEGTGNVLLYYNFAGTGSEILANTSPSATVGLYNAEIDNLLTVNDIFLNDISGVDLSRARLKFGPFQNNHKNINDLDGSLTFLFSFEKKKTDAGILFGSLVKDSFTLNGSDFYYGRGFNIGINSRNQLFFQGIDGDQGEYVLTSNSIEMANRNICSVAVSPYNIIVTKYDLLDDSFQEQSLFNNCKISNNQANESYYLGGSPTFYRGEHSFSGQMDEFLILSGFYSSFDLKSIASGFYATGIPLSGQTYQDSVITGSEISITYRSGVTGYEPYITGYSQTIQNSELIEFVLVENLTPLSRKDGERFLTGYAVPNSSGSYLEETSFLIKTNKYSTTGDDPFGTLGLSDQTNLVTQYTLQSLRISSITGTVPLYGLRPVTGALLNEPMAYSVAVLSGIISRTGTILESLSLDENIIKDYDYDFLYFLKARI